MNEKNFIKHLNAILDMQIKGYAVIRDYAYFNPRNNSYTYHIVYSNAEMMRIEDLSEEFKTILSIYLIGVKDYD